MCRLTRVDNKPERRWQHPQEALATWAYADMIGWYSSCYTIPLTPFAGLPVASAMRREECV